MRSTFLSDLPSGGDFQKNFLDPVDDKLDGNDGQKETHQTGEHVNSSLPQDSEKSPRFPENGRK
jgi:hypothetical protein